MRNALGFCRRPIPSEWKTNTTFVKAIMRRAKRFWLKHLSQEDVDALKAALAAEQAKKPQ